ncbi:chromophore lyase CpcT/CpeT [Phormidium tenue FACHB-886]|nr:chromophore lyase CpcT/CpeT [Phormidium tenue FACHB-886]
MSLPSLANWLAGEFDNQPQAIADPLWFVHLRLWHRPVKLQLEGHLALFAEQANALQLDRPYRQRIAVLQPTADPQIQRVQYWGFKQPDLFRGAGANPQQLERLSLEDLELLPGCVLTVTQQGDRFKAEPPSGAKCCFQYEAQTRQVVLGFEVSETQFWSFDRGVDPNTGAALWGAVMGAYTYNKRQSFSWKD